MCALSLYLDTSVIGGYFDPGFASDTRALWRLKEAGHFRFVSSVLVVQEVALAPERVRKLLRFTFALRDMQPMTPEAIKLADRYLAHKVVSLNYTDDARHVAVCSIARIDYLVSWNFKHLPNVRRETGFNGVNALQGYPPVRIVAPTFLIHGYPQKDL